MTKNRAAPAHPDQSQRATWIPAVSLRDQQISQAAQVVLSSPEPYVSEDCDDFCARLTWAAQHEGWEAVRDVLRSVPKVRRLLEERFPEGARARTFAGGGKLSYG